jgi:hypothetical protein
MTIDEVATIVEKVFNLKICEFLLISLFILRNLSKESR